MRTRAPSPWPLLLAALRRSNRPRLDRAEIEAAGIDPEALLGAGLIERAAATATWRPPSCEHGCLPNFDFDTRRAEGLVGVACPEDPACWPGLEWYPAAELECFTCSASRVLGILGAENGLDPLDAVQVAPAVAVGTLVARGKRVPVVWMPRPPSELDVICRGLRAGVTGDGLAVLLGRPKGAVPRLEAGEIAVLNVPESSCGDLELWRALDLLDPEYRQTRVTEPTAVFDDVSIELGTVPGERHVVRINGHDLGGFRRGDLNFLRLLYLATARAMAPQADGGWVPKWRLQGDDKDHDLERLRKELAKHEYPDLTPEELKSLIKSSPERDSTIRLAVHPKRIWLDPSIAELELLGDRQTKSKKRGRRHTPGSALLDANLSKGKQVARKLLADARKLGAPGPVQGK